MNSDIGKAPSRCMYCVDIAQPRYNESIGLYQVMILGIMVVPTTK